MSENPTVPAEVVPEQFSRGDWSSLIWGLWWRGFVFMLAIALAGGLVGALIGVGFGVAGTVAKIPLERIMLPAQIFSALVGLAIAIWSYRFYVTWILRARYGSLRLAVVRVNAGPGTMGAVH